MDYVRCFRFAVVVLVFRKQNKALGQLMISALLRPQPVSVLQQAQHNLCNYHGICKSREFQITRHALFVMSRSAIRVN